VVQEKEEDQVTIDSDANERAEMDSRQAAIYRKVTLRLVPFLFVCLVMATLDRLNIGYAQLQMKHDLGFSDLVYGIGASMFFVAYFFFEVPSNLILERVGARKVIARIMICWGVVSAATMFVSTPWHLYMARFLLGFFEAGFVPGILLYLTYWYPQPYRGRVSAYFFSAAIVAGLLGGPISGWIMVELNNVAGLKGWQWMFLLEGLPATLVGVVAWHYLDDKPAAARWLTEPEREIVVRNLQAYRASRSGTEHVGIGTVIRDPRVWLLAFIYFTLLSGGYTLSYWLPTLIKDLGVSDVKKIGSLSAIPYIAGLILMVYYARRSDARGERRWHYFTAVCVGGSLLALSATLPQDLFLILGLLTIAGAFTAAALPVFWAVPPCYLSERGAAAGLAVVTSVGQLGGVVAGALIGWLRDATGSMTAGLSVIAALMIIAGLLMIVGVPARMVRERAWQTDLRARVTA
jgi:D-galactonate transporter